MSDLTSTSWTELDASNTQTPPEGAPSGMFPNASEGVWRMHMGAMKRTFNRLNPVYPTTQSTADSYVISPTVAPLGYGLYERWRARFNIANASTSPTINISSLGPLNFVKYSSGSKVALAAGDIQAQDHEFWYDGAGNAVLINPNPAPTGVSNLSATSNSGLNYSAATGAVVSRVDPSTLTVKASPTSSDSVMGQSAGATIPSSFPLPALIAFGAYPAKATPTTSDSLLLYDGALANAPSNALLSAVRSAVSRVAQVVGNETGAVATGTTAIAQTDSIPQNTNGDQYLTQAITPKNANSTLLIDVWVVGSASAGNAFVVALFQDSTANALAAVEKGITANGVPIEASFRHRMTAGTVSSTTFNVRAGGSSGTFTLNGASSARLMGGVMASSITITEILP